MGAVDPVSEWIVLWLVPEDHWEMHCAEVDWPIARSAADTAAVVVAATEGLVLGSWGSERIHQVTLEEADTLAEGTLEPVGSPAVVDNPEAVLGSLEVAADNLAGGDNLVVDSLAAAAGSRLGEEPASPEAAAILAVEVDTLPAAVAVDILVVPVGNWAAADSLAEVGILVVVAEDRPVGAVGSLVPAAETAVEDRFGVELDRDIRAAEGTA